MLKKLLYALFFGLCFLIGLYWTFPAESLRPLIINQIIQALDSQTQGMRLITPNQVRIGDLNLWRFPGLALEDLKIQLGSDNSEPGPEFSVKSLKIRMAIFSTLSGNPRFKFDTEIYGGRAQGRVTFNQQNGLADLWIDLNRLDIAKLRGPVTGDQLRLAGQVNLDAEINTGKNLAKDGSGKVEADFKGLSIGPGMFEIPGGFGETSLPKIRLGHFVLKASLNKGKASIKNFKLTGGDIEADISAQVDLVENIILSPLKGSGWFKLDPEWAKENPKFSMILDMSPEIKAAEDASGKIHFTLFGSLMAPTPKWGKE